jgi:type VI secretion system secreted protein VgrG
MDINAAVKYLDDNTEDSSTGRCALYVRRALEAGGVDLTHHPFSAKDYGPTLLTNGFSKFFEFQQIKPPTEAADGATVKVSHSRSTSDQQYVPKKGDVAVIQPYQGGDSNGHIAMYDGAQWVSDFKQRDMWGGAGYRKYKPPCIVYRP